MKNLFILALIISVLSCSKAPSEGLSFINDGNIIKVKIGAASTQEQLNTLKDSLLQHKIILDLTTVEYNQDKQIKNIKMTVDSDLGKGTTACCNNSSSEEPIMTQGFIVDKNAGSAKPFCLGSDCFK
jgi:hypothetical protein